MGICCECDRVLEDGLCPACDHPGAKICVKCGKSDIDTVDMLCLSCAADQDDGGGERGVRIDESTSGVRRACFTDAFIMIIDAESAGFLGPILNSYGEHGCITQAMEIAADNKEKGGEMAGFSFSSLPKGPEARFVDAIGSEWVARVDRDGDLLLEGGGAGIYLDRDTAEYLAVVLDAYANVGSVPTEEPKLETPVTRDQVRDLIKTAWDQRGRQSASQDDQIAGLLRRVQAAEERLDLIEVSVRAFVDVQADDARNLGQIEKRLAAIEGWCRRIDQEIAYARDAVAHHEQRCHLG